MPCFLSGLVSGDNTCFGKALLPSAPASAFAHIGTGNNIIYVDPEHDVVAVMPWINGGAAAGFVRRLLAAID